MRSACFQGYKVISWFPRIAFYKFSLYPLQLGALSTTDAAETEPLLGLLGQLGMTHAEVSRAAGEGGERGVHATFQRKLSSTCSHKHS
jgi:hypothetical protein